MDDNVVRLPRDWLGPREELVPFGPSAYTEANGAREGYDLPPTADDFWGEDSASVQDAVQAPTRERSAALATELRASRAGARDVGRRHAVSASLLLLALAAVLGMLMLIPAGNPRRGAPAPEALAARAGQLTAGSGLGSAGLVSGRADNGRGPARSRRAPSAGTRSPRGGRRSSGHGARAGSTRAGRDATRAAHQAKPMQRDSGAGAATVQPVRYTQPPSTGAASTPSSSSTSPSPEPSATASSGTSSEASGTGNHPALGANGTLAPGSSPDG